RPAPGGSLAEGADRRRLVSRRTVARERAARPGRADARPCRRLDDESAHRCARLRELLASLAAAPGGGERRLQAPGPRPRTRQTASSSMCDPESARTDVGSNPAAVTRDTISASASAVV